MKDRMPETRRALISKCPFRRRPLSKDAKRWNVRYTSRISG